jgi:hypothetical protein
MDKYMILSGSGGLHICAEIAVARHLSPVIKSGFGPGAIYKLKKKCGILI